MLTRANRLTSSHVFAHTVRRGRRAGARSVVVHLDAEADVLHPQVGLVVSKAVGPAATRNLVKRRLRHLSRERLGSLPASAVLVVRALPPAAHSSYADLGADLDKAIARALTPAPRFAAASRDVRT